MRVAIFGGSFDPVHREHTRLVRAAIDAFGFDRVWIVPSFRAPHKLGARACGEDRFEMCRIAFRGIPEAEVSDFELSCGGTSYSYLTCRRFAEVYPECERYFLVGADMLENFFHWKNPEDILSNVTLAACGRGEENASALHERFRCRFGTDFLEFPFVGEDVSSTDIRVALAFGKRPPALDEAVFSYLCARGLYRYPQESALELETPARREHSYRVARLACKRARSLGIPEEKALLAAMLHDCGKYVSSDSPLLKGFDPPKGTPEPVLHQYTGAFLAEHCFGITDGEILGAIRCHTSGKEDMTVLEKLLYLSDLLEEGRRFEGVERLRSLFWKDLDECLISAMELNLEYLFSTGKPVFPLTERAYRWLKEHNG